MIYFFSLVCFDHFRDEQIFKHDTIDPVEPSCLTSFLHDKNMNTIDTVNQMNQIVH